MHFNNIYIIQLLLVITSYNGTVAGNWHFVVNLDVLTWARQSR